MKKDNDIEKIKYIECDCKSFDHIMRLFYCNYENGKFEELGIEFGIQNFPRGYKGQSQYSFSYGDGFKSFYKNLITRIVMIIDKIKNYFIAIWWAIKGRPQWYIAHISINKKNAKEIVKFINEVYFKEGK